MSGVLPDVNLLLASAWETHSEHQKARKWLIGLDRFLTCPITELGFIRVSMSPAYAAGFRDAAGYLSSVQKLTSADRIHDDFNAAEIPAVRRHKDTTDAYLLKLAAAHNLRFATLDRALLKADWADGIAFNPLEDSPA
jgi:toxin-antitoxin system PIN domain toxin